MKKQTDSIKEPLAFDCAEIVVELSIFGEETLISRSQAKCIIRSLEKFNYIILDFKGWGRDLLMKYSVFLLKNIPM